MIKYLTAPACVLAIAPLAAASAQPHVPDTEWTVTTPDGVGWSSLASAHADAARIGTARLLVVQHGVVVDSVGDVTSRLQLYSVRKSLLSALIGIAVAERKIDPNATLATLGIDDVPPALTDVEKRATVRELLESRSGVYHVALYETKGEGLKRPPLHSHPHGTFWYYNNWDDLVVSSIRQTTGPLATANSDT
jgi:CubicO group peptidase (beta-lactamase class C family)